jgi:hypothetical protein
MAQSNKPISPSIYLIADHLDAVLAHGEDLLALEPPPPLETGQDIAHMQQRLADHRAFLEQVRTLEGRLVHRVLRAREHAEQVRRVDGRFKMITDLFAGGTHALADAAADLADVIALDFNTGRDSIAYLRSRGLIGDGTMVLPRGFTMRIGESFRLAGAGELGALLDLAATYIEALELHYDLYGEEAADGAKRPEATDAQPTASP